MVSSIVSDVINISKDCLEIDKSLEEVCGGEIVRWAIIEVGVDYYKISYSYKK